MKANLPVISSTTFGEKFVILYILITLLPIFMLFSHLHDEPKDIPDLRKWFDLGAFYTTIVIVSVSTLVIIFLTVKQNRRLH